MSSRDNEGQCGRGSPKNNNEWKPPLYATAKRHKAVVKLLLARKDVEVDSVDDDEQTPLLIMVMKGDEAVVELLARSDAEINSRDQCGQALLILRIVVEPCFS